MYRYLDDWRAHRCEMDIFNPELKNNTDGLWSGTNSYYKYENDNIVKEMHSSSSLIANMYEKDGPSYWTNVNMTAYLTEKKPIAGIENLLIYFVFNFHCRKHPGARRGVCI